MDKETYTFEDRVYVNPETSLNEQLGFVDKLRSLQQEGTDKITRDTHNLGTDVTPNLGGLTGAEGMWQQQYVTPRVNTMLSNLRATAQAQALNDVLGNYQNQMKQRYNNAYRAASRSGGGGGGTGGGNPDGGDNEGEVDWRVNNGTGYDANGVDSVIKRKGAPKASGAINSANAIAGMTGGGQLPNSNTRTYYLQAPNGNRSWIVVRNGLNGPGIDTPKVSMHGSGNIRNYIDSRLQQGYKVVDGKGNDLSSRYILLWGL